MKKILSFLLFFSLALFTLCFYRYLSIYSFDSSKVKHRIEFLSSDTFKGRLTGTKENEAVASYIKNEFKNAGLKPFKGEYSQNFTTLFPNKIEGTPYLRVIDKQGEVIKTYVYGQDYKEDMLNFKVNSFTFNNKDNIKTLEAGFQITKENGSFMLYVPPKDDLNFRSSFISSSSHNMYIMITKNTLQDIKNQLSKNYTLQCFIPYEIKETLAQNVLGLIPGKNPSLSPIIISAHFDHVGTDLSGNVYSGALDNASGISFLLEFMKYIHSLGVPDRDILFIGFNAEEFGCIGSTKFVETYKDLLHDSKLFNFDMIGSDTSVPLCLMGGKKDIASLPFMRSLASTCNDEKIYFNYLFEDASDHEAFRKNNIDAITFCDNDIRRIHTTNDKVSFINTSSIDRCFKVVSTEIIRYGFLSNPLLLYTKPIMMVSFCSSFFFAILFIYNKKPSV